MESIRIQFRTGSESFAKELASRTEVWEVAPASYAAEQQLTRYFALLAMALASVALTPGEAGMLVDICNGTRFDPIELAAQALVYDVQDAMPDGYAEKWEIDGAALVAKLQGYNLLQRVAICDAIERFWAATTIENTSVRLVHVGLVRHA